MVSVRSVGGIERENKVRTARREPADHWSAAQLITLLGCAVALLVGATALTITFGIFLLPISKSFGWGRDVVTSAMAGSMAGAAIALPFFGRLLDRFDPRIIAAIGTCLLAAVTALLSCISSSRPVLYLLFVLWGLTSSSQTALPYMKIISAWFPSGRGLAIGLMLLGAAIGAALMPWLTEQAIARFGWRFAFIGLGCVIVMLAVPAQLLLIRWPPPLHEQKPQARNADTEIGPDDSAFRVAARSSPFWALAVSLFLIANVLNGIQINLFALLKDRAFSDQAAALAVSVAGLAMICGRLLAGFLMDHFRKGFVAALFFALPEITIALLWHPASQWEALAASAVVGVCSGAEIAVAAVIIAALFDLRYFGRIYAWVYLAFIAGTGSGPWMMAYIYERTRSYSAGLLILASFSLIATILALSINRSRQLAAHT